MGRILAIDYGRKRCGVAVTDPAQIIANALETVPTHLLMDFLKAYLGANQVDPVVIGMPRQMNGQSSASFTYIEPFARRLRKEFPELRIEWMDERFTSKLAMAAMITGGVKKSKRQDKALVDRVSAAIILQSYLESRS